MKWGITELTEGLIGKSAVIVKGHLDKYPLGGVELPLPTTRCGSFVLVNGVQAGYIATFKNKVLQLWVTHGIEAVNAKDIDLELLFIAL